MLRFHSGSAQVLIKFWSGSILVLTRFWLSSAQVLLWFCPSFDWVLLRFYPGSAQVLIKFCSRFYPASAQVLKLKAGPCRHRLTFKILKYISFTWLQTAHCWCASYCDTAHILANIVEFLLMCRACGVIGTQVLIQLTVFGNIPSSSSDSI